MFVIRERLYAQPVYCLSWVNNGATLVYWQPLLLLLQINLPKVFTVGNDYVLTNYTDKAKNTPKEPAMLNSSCKMGYNEKYTESVAFRVS